MRFFLFVLLLAALLAATAPPRARGADWADATPTAWHQLARAESLLSAPEPPNPVAVCVVDSGVNMTPDLEGVVIERLAYDGGDPGDTYPQEGIDDGHGTYVATFLAGQVNGWGGAGLWPRAKIVSVRVFPPGAKRARAADYIRGLRTCVQHPDVRVINLSLNDVDATLAEKDELRDRIAEYRLQRGVNVVVAAGNRGGSVEAPASYPAALAVGGVDRAGALCSFSARGETLDIVAPGCGLSGAGTAGSSVEFAGTSFAAPMVSATLAALRAYRGLTADQAEEALVRASRVTSAGALLDVAGALSPLSFEWSPPSSPPIDGQATSSIEGPIGDEFVDYPRPRLRLQRLQNRYRIRVLNRPAHAALEVARGRTSYETTRNLLWIHKRLSRSLRLRFIGDHGASSWLRVKRFGGRSGW